MRRQSTFALHMAESIPTKFTGTSSSESISSCPKTDQKRIDVHPLARNPISRADIVFFVLEGALKNDAMLSAGVAVISVPSVTLWKPSEINRFAWDYLRGKTVFVVPDADWVEKPGVKRAALSVREHLRVVPDVRAYLAAPPVRFYKDMQARGVPGMKGVDDFLGLPGERWCAETGHPSGVEGLVVAGREPGRACLPKLDSYLQRAVVSLSLHADERHAHERSLLSLMTVIGTDKPDIAIARLIESRNET